jgi:signal transduction histidine kinase
MARPLLPTERTMVQAVAVARWGAWLWAALVALLQRDDMRHPAVAWVLLLVALGLAATLTVLLRRDPGLLVEPPAVVAELALAFALLVADGVVYDEGHAFGGGQNLAGALPFVAVLSAATALGPWWGMTAGAGLGTGRLFGALANGVDSFTGKQLVSLAATVVFYGLTGFVWGWITRRLRVVEEEVVMRRARDEVARTLHDTVLQTLALVSRRAASTDPELAAAARRTDRELRSWLAGGVPATDLATAVRAAATAAASGHDLDVVVNVIDEGARLDRREVAALAGAVREAVANAARHASATKVIVYGEADDDAVFVSVRDDGHGFDPADMPEGTGISRSIKGRMADVGGRAEIWPNPDAGTEVRLWLR